MAIICANAQILSRVLMCSATRTFVTLKFLPPAFSVGTFRAMDTPHIRIEEASCDAPQVIHPKDGGSPYFIHPSTGFPVFLSKRRGPPITSEDVREWLKDFP